MLIWILNSNLIVTDALICTFLGLWVWVLTQNINFCKTVIFINCLHSRVFAEPRLFFTSEKLWDPLFRPDHVTDLLSCWTFPVFGNAVLFSVSLLSALCFLTWLSFVFQIYWMFSGAAMCRYVPVCRAFLASIFTSCWWSRETVT